jgi:hypothetical protein
MHVMARKHQLHPDESIISGLERAPSGETFDQILYYVIIQSFDADHGAGRVHSYDTRTA